MTPYILFLMVTMGPGPWDRHAIVLDMPSLETCAAALKAWTRVGFDGIPFKTMVGADGTTTGMCVKRAGQEESR